MEDKKCECGCGSLCRNRFTLGHQIRNNNPMNNPKTAALSAANKNYVSIAAKASAAKKARRSAFIGARKAQESMRKSGILLLKGRKAAETRKRTGVDRILADKAAITRAERGFYARHSIYMEINNPMFRAEIAKKAIKK